MRAKSHPLHLEIQRHRSNYYGLIRSSYREDGKVKHDNHGRITGLDLPRLKLIQAAFKNGVMLKESPSDYRAYESKEYGASFALLELARQLGLDKTIYSRPSEGWVKDCLAMIAGRVVYAGSKLELSNRWADTALWELCGTEGAVDVDLHCYTAMDRLLARQTAIQQTLADKHLKNGALVLYDITSSYFEGAYEDSDIVRFGYNRDGKRGHEQMVIGLLCSPEGCPVGVEVFPGNTQDAKTVPDKIAELQKTYGIKELIFVGDRGMVTHANYDKVKDIKGLNTISALTHREIVELLTRKVIQPGLFDEQDIVEVVDPDNPRLRYCLCRNPNTADREDATRKSLIAKTRKALDKIANRKRRGAVEKISAQVGKILDKTKMGKFVDWKVEDGRLKWSFKEGKIAGEELMDGCYIIRSDAPPEVMDKQEVVASYKKLTLVEQAFRNLKTVQLEIRPVWHKTDDRIRAHVFLCMLAYYLQWHMQQRLKPLFAGNGRGKKRQWSFELVIERLKSIRRERLRIGEDYCRIVTDPDKDQQKILDLLQLKL
jgi:transposase